MKTIKLFAVFATLIIGLNCYSQSAAILRTYTEVEWGSYILICINDKKVNAFYAGRIGQNDFQTFLIGTIDNNVVIGNSTSLWWGFGESSKETGTFRIEINTDNSNIKLFQDQATEPTEFGLIEFSKLLGKPNLPYSFSGIINFRSDPNATSKILSKIDFEKTQVRLLEIGNIEQIGDETDFWYKVKFNEVEGWIFGGLSFF